jgi:hypothetical protein
MAIDKSKQRILTFPINPGIYTVANNVVEPAGREFGYPSKVSMMEFDVSYCAFISKAPSALNVGFIEVDTVKSSITMGGG